MAVPSEGMSRHFVTPVTMVLFIVSTVTGVMLFFHWQSGLVHVSHEWLSIVFSGIAVWHLVRNWRPFIGYLKRMPAISALVLSLVASTVFTFATGHVEGGEGGGGPRVLFSALAKAPVERIAPAFGLSSEAALARLKAAGIDAAAADTLQAIGERSGRDAPKLLFLFASKEGGHR